MPSPTDSATHIGALDTSLPQVATCTVSQLDDFIRHLKTVLKTDLANVNGAVTASHTELNYVAGVTSALQTQINLKAPLASPAFTGTPSLPTGSTGVTQAANDNSTKLATTAYVDALRVPGEWVLITDTTISGSPSSVDFTSGIGATYDQYLVTLSAVKPGTDSVALNMRTSTNAGSSYDSTAGNYWYQAIYGVGGTGPGILSDGGSATSIQIIPNLGNAAGEEGASGELMFWKPSATAPLLVQWSVIGKDAAVGNIGQYNGSAFRTAVADVDAIRFLFSSGTMASGRIKLFGRKV